MNNAQARRPRPIRVIVVDDSPTVRNLLVAILQNTGDIQVVGTATNGEDAVRITRRLKPDVITMDINMPRMGGLEATRQIMTEIPTPIVVVSGSMMLSEMDLAFEALQAGALTLVRTPGLNDPEMCEQIIQTVRLMADVPVVRRWEISRPRANGKPATPVIPLPLPALSRDRRGIEVIGIASSTGGPVTLANILRPLPANFPIPILVVQHVTVGFGAGLAEWLNGEIALPVSIALHGRPLQPGTVMLAPDDYHLQINLNGLIELIREPQYRGLRPSANYLFNSLANIYGRHAVGVILTGMGDDGVDGLDKLHRAGGLTIAQDEKSCVVYGMPRAAVERQAVDQVLPPDQIALSLIQLGQSVQASAQGRAS